MIVVGERDHLQQTDLDDGEKNENGGVWTANEERPNLYLFHLPFHSPTSSLVFIFMDHYCWMDEEVKVVVTAFRARQTGHCFIEDCDPSMCPPSFFLLIPFAGCPAPSPIWALWMQAIHLKLCSTMLQQQTFCLVFYRRWMNSWLGCRRWPSSTIFP